MQAVAEYERRVAPALTSVTAGICEHVAAQVENVFVIEEPTKNSSDTNNQKCSDGCKKKCCNHTHGGARNLLNTADKASCADEEAVRQFIADAVCFCGERCCEKIRNLGEEGERVVKQLRDDRFSGHNNNVLTIDRN